MTDECPPPPDESCAKADRGALACLEVGHAAGRKVPTKAHFGAKQLHAMGSAKPLVCERWNGVGEGRVASSATATATWSLSRPVAVPSSCRTQQDSAWSSRYG